MSSSALDYIIRLYKLVKLANNVLCFQENNGTLLGEGCDSQHYVPDVFLMSIILFLGTYILSVILKDFKNSLFFPSKARLCSLIITPVNYILQ